MERPGRSSNRPFWVKRYSDYRATRMPVIEVSGTSARAGVDHGQDAHAATVDELIGDEVERPAVVRPLRNQHRRPRAQSPLAAAPPADHEAHLAIEPE